jgi:hypothetical protein
MFPLRQRLRAVWITFLAALAGCSSDHASELEGAAGVDGPVGAVALEEVKFGQCESQLGNTGFHSDFFPRQLGSAFSVGFDVQPLSDPAGSAVDAVIGLSNGPADAFSDLGPIVRFNPAGVVDARNGAEYAAVNAAPYRAEWQFYHVHMDVNLETHRYSAWVNEHGFPAVQIADAFAFRSEQSAVPSLDAVGRIVDTGTASMSFCGLDVTPARCTMSSAGTAWHAESFTPRTGRLRVEFDATPLSIREDAVIGVSQGIPTAFRDLAVIFRFNADGFMDARNGGAYAADVPMPYELGRPYHVALDIDGTARRYWVTVGIPGYDARSLASGFQFRTEQAAVAALDSVATFVDGAEGDVNVCNVVWGYYD